VNCWCKTRRRRECGWEGSETPACCVRVVRCASMRSLSSLDTVEGSLLMWGKGFME
jgi:hypothetical protein